jgi:hypothetical protein
VFSPIGLLLSLEIATIYVMSMTRTTVYISNDTKRRLTLASRRHQRSEAELIREAIDGFLAREPAQPRPAPPSLSFDPRVVDDLDEHLASGFGADGMERD